MRTSSKAVPCRPIAVEVELDAAHGCSARNGTAGSQRRRSLPPLRTIHVSLMPMTPDSRSATMPRRRIRTDASGFVPSPRACSIRASNPLIALASFGDEHELFKLLQVHVFQLSHVNSQPTGCHGLGDLHHRRRLPRSVGTQSSEFRLYGPVCWPSSLLQLPESRPVRPRPHAWRTSYVVAATYGSLAEMISHDGRSDLAGPFRLVALSGRTASSVQDGRSWLSANGCSRFRRPPVDGGRRHDNASPSPGCGSLDCVDDGTIARRISRTPPALRISSSAVNSTSTLIERRPAWTAASRAGVPSPRSGSRRWPGARERNASRRHRGAPAGWPHRQRARRRTEGRRLPPARRPLRGLPAG